MSTAEHGVSRQESCFYISPIGKADSEVRKRSNQIFQHVVRNTLEGLGFELVRADYLDESGAITSQIIDRLLNSNLVVADLTDHNPNVFYELVIRHAVAKPFIQLIAEDQALPFDIQVLRTIPLDHRDLDSVHEAREVLGGMGEGIRLERPVETPLTYILNLQNLRHSEDSKREG